MDFHLENNRLSELAERLFTGQTREFKEFQVLTPLQTGQKYSFLSIEAFCSIFNRVLVETRHV